jgi:hypothetical protein
MYLPINMHTLAFIFYTHQRHVYEMKSGSARGKPKEPWVEQFFLELILSPPPRSPYLLCTHPSFTFFLPLLSLLPLLPSQRHQL